ncbi:pentatricopeptide repeat-containing protein At1g11290, chloroplastic-like [Aristolochia californica]|uniref:pentatricopeptide repeat-containing protein At1g11290, chloroplastic-like n=1 Tax=Aristolochia californica TaxID=171875 RepID=UPI0035D52BAE
MIRSHLHLNLFFSTTLLTQYASLRSLNYAYAVFSVAETSDVFLWNVMIRAFAESGHYEQSIQLYRRMFELGVTPDNFTFTFVLKAPASLREIEQGKKIHADAREFGYELDIFVGNSLIAMYGKCGLPDVSRQVFEKMYDKNVVSWSSMIGAYVQNGCFEDGLSLFHRMLDEKVRPNRVTVLNLIPCISKRNEADELYRVIVEHRLQSDICVQNAVMGMYAKCRRIDIAQGIFRGIKEKDLVTWSSMIEALVQADLPMEALELFKEMKSNNLHPDYVAMLSIIGACSKLASLMQARQLHGVTIQSSFQRELIVQTALVDLYVKCGSLEYARMVFDRMRDRNRISWSTIISGYGMHGRGKEALELFNRMKASMKPDHIIFVSVLSACSHAGLIEEGWHCFNSMVVDFDITPRTEHYACMVDLLGRAGKLNEAVEFMKNMPMKPDAGVWGSLLGACRIHSNVELAEWAAKSLFEIDPENSGRYVLLSNIYLSSGKRQEADQVRALMRRRGVKKTAGHTVIEVKNKMYKFLVGDRSNPQTKLIYEELESLILRIKDAGYVPNTNFVLHDVEEEAKEKMLYVHSEKLAIVFGLINSSSRTVIRITKNLRVCEDCHTAIKYISKVTGREIVMRDAHRFHHFKEGSCSCGDYW